MKNVVASGRALEGRLTPSHPTRSLAILSLLRHKRMVRLYVEALRFFWRVLMRMSQVRVSMELETQTEQIP